MILMVQISQLKETLYGRKNPGVKGFCNKGWVHFKAMDNLISGRHAKGANAFCPSLIPTSVSSFPISTNAPNSLLSISGSSLPFPPQTPRSDQPYPNNNPHLTMPTIPAGLRGAESPNMQRSDAGVSDWLIGLPSPKSLPPPQMRMWM
ncbi:hypothetical protein SERLA73DRAFT_187577 [Serpula lacrymans var. lacrymans S7.3]|uniref:Uncharacterized protein n=1 Tax=Serpula lacrymans var. lacrymans (strain S7.3) TaxID=936435 RepID=F8Q9I9_SERL3|nr:hypothetical protein SERLA73DRAFT_187577 [Serpula lacrymans var. lacrymans S7.3]